MDIKTVTKQVLSSDGVHTLNGIVYLPEGSAKGIFHLVHGMTEYIGRYKDLLSAVAASGYIACGFDNLGHGETASKDELGFIAERDGYKYLVDDVIRFGDSVKSDFPDLPYYLMGHSMGSFIVRLATVKYGEKIDKLIICGTGGPNPAAPAGILVCDLLKVFKGGHGYSSLIENMAFGTYNKRFPGGGKYEWLTKDEKIKKMYAADPLCTYRFTVSALKDLVKLNLLSNKPNWFKGIRKDLPILLISGEDDPVGDYGKGVKTVYNRLKEQGCNARIKLYKNCRHEIHNDTCKEESAQDILKFITE